MALVRKKKIIEEERRRQEKRIEGKKHIGVSMYDV